MIDPSQYLVLLASALIAEGTPLVFGISRGDLIESAKTVLSCSAALLFYYSFQFDSYALAIYVGLSSWFIIAGLAEAMAGRMERFGYYEGGIRAGMKGMVEEMDAFAQQETDQVARVGLEKAVRFAGMLLDLTEKASERRREPSGGKD